ncbi:hypothetical protein [Paenibacillus shirakamiensis]|nr:hypothetical protein [Paenibacillus shirakamiensis]
MILIFIGLMVVPLFIIEMNRRRTLTEELNRTFLGYSCLTIGLQVIFLFLFITDVIQALGIWGHIIWWWVCLSGIYIAVYGIWKITKNRINVVFFFITGGIGSILLILYIMGVFITSM